MEEDYDILLNPFEDYWDGDLVDHICSTCKNIYEAEDYEERVLRGKIGWYEALDELKNRCKIIINE